MTALIVLMALQFGAVSSAAGVCQSAAAKDVYALLLEDRYHGTPASQMSVKDTAIVMPTLRGSSAEWLKQFEMVPLELRRAASQPQPTKRHSLDASQFPPGTKLVSSSAVEKVFTGGIEENWSEFRRQFGSRGWLAFSGVLHTGDGLNALVYYEARCGGLCGEGGYVWLRRQKLAAPWQIARKIVSWMS